MSYSLDPIFKQNLCDALGQQVLDKFLQALNNEPAAVSVRRNPFKLDETAFTNHFTLLSDGKVTWCSDGIYLTHRPQFQMDPLTHAGAFYVQDAASMAVQSIFSSLTGSGPLRALDLCAAPGGKSTCIVASLLTDRDILVSNEVIRSRATVLAENMTKWGRANVVVTKEL